MIFYENMLNMVKHYYYIFLVMFITISSCTKNHENTNTKNNEDTKPTNPEPQIRESAFKTIDGWPGSIKMRRVGESFSESIENVQVDSSGAIWVLREARINPDKYEFKKYLEKYDGQGNFIFGLSEPVGTILRSFTIHPSGELTIAELRKRKEGEEPSSHNMWLKRIRSDGSIIIETPLRDPGKPEEKQFYLFEPENNKWKHKRTFQRVNKFDDGDILIINNMSVLDGTSSILLASEEDVYLYATTHGSKLYKFDKNLQMSWNRQILPFSQNLLGFDHCTKLAIDENSNIYVVNQTFEEDLLAWELHFGKTLDKEALISSLLVTQIDPHGNLKVTRAFGKNEHLESEGFTVRDGIITAGGKTRIQGKFTEPNHTQENNLFFLRAEIASGRVIDYTIIETQRDAWVDDFRVNAEGHGFFAGVNDFIQVDTNCRVEFGQGYILKVDEHGNKQSYLNFRGPRDTRVKSISLLGNGKLIFGGTFNGPISHTGDADRKQNFEWAMLGIADIN